MLSLVNIYGIYLLDKSTPCRLQTRYMTRLKIKTDGIISFFINQDLVRMNCEYEAHNCVTRSQFIHLNVFNF